VAPEAVLRARIARRQAENHDASDADQEVLSLQLRICEIPASEEAALRWTPTPTRPWCGGAARVGEPTLISARGP
jgi:predicted kinase